MSTQADVRSPAAEAGDQVLSAVLFELDGVAVATRPVIYQAAQQALGRQKSSLTPAFFARYGLAGSQLAAAQELVERLGATSVTGEELARAIADRISSFLASADAGLNSGLDKLLKAAAQRGIPAAAVTALPEDVAKAALDRLGLTDRGVRLFAFRDDEKPFPRVDAWLKVAKSLGKSARFCVAVASTQASCKSALSAGMRCVAVPDSYTSHHDFGGADVVLDSWDDISANELLDCVAPAVVS